MCKCNESSNCSNSSKSFGEGNVNACTTKQRHNEINRNGQNYKNDPMRKDVNNMEKNNNNAGRIKTDLSRVFEEFLMENNISPLGFILNIEKENIDSILEGKCPFFNESREKCQKCHLSFNNKNDSDTSDEEENHQDESSADDLHLFKDGEKIPLGKVLAHLANAIDSIGITVDKMAEMHNGVLIEAEPIMMEGFNHDESFDKINRKLSKMNRRIKDLDTKIEMLIEINTKKESNIK